MALEVLTIQNCLHGHLADANIGQYLMRQFTKTIDAVDWQVFQAIIAPSVPGGRPDSNGLFRSQQQFLDMPTQFARNDTKDINGNLSGQHDGGNDQAGLTDSTASWGTNDLVGAYVVNETDGSCGRITANTATGVTAILAGGTDNNWDNNDVYTIGGPASIIRFVLIDFGITSTDIDDTSFGASELTFAGWNLVWNGAFFYKQSRTQVLSTLLTMCHSTLRITEKVELHVLSKTSQKTITKADIMRQAGGESTFSHTFIRQEYSDSGYIAFQEADESQDEFLKVIVPAKASETKISGEILTVPFVQDSQDAQRIGTLHYQRKFLKSANGGFISKGTLLALQPDDVLTIDDADYGGSFDVVVDTMFINRDLSIEYRFVKYSVALDDWGDLAPGAITIYADDSGTYWAPMICGPTGGASVGEAPSILPGDLVIGDATNNIILDQTNMRISLRTGALADWQHFTERLRIGNLNGYLDYTSNIYGFAVSKDATNYVTVDPINGVRISASGANAITIKSGGNIKIEGGGDIVFIGSDTDPGIIQFQGTDVTLQIAGDVTGEYFGIIPTIDNAGYLYLGSDYIPGETNWEWLYGGGEQDADTKLLLHCDGLDGSTNIRDSSQSAHGITVVGNAQIDTAQKKFGTGSVLFGASGDSLSVLDHADWFMDTGKFTIDCWFRLDTTLGAGKAITFWDQTEGVNDKIFFRYLESAGTKKFYLKVYTGGAVVVALTSADISVSLNAWHHIALIRGWSGNANDWAICLNGAPIATATDASSWADYAANPLIRFFNTSGNCWIDEPRVSKGVARWTADFSASLPTEAYKGAPPGATPNQVRQSYLLANEAVLIGAIYDNADNYAIQLAYSDASECYLQQKVHCTAGATYAQIKVYDDGTNPYVEVDAESFRMPNQPAFCAYPAAQQSNIAINNWIDIAFATERYDQGNDFSTPTFTAPVGGKYSFSGVVGLLNVDTAADYYHIRLMTSNEYYYFVFDPGGFVGDVVYWTVPICIDVDMDANDTAKLQFYQAVGTAQTDVRADSFFSGHLIG